MRAIDADHLRRWILSRVFKSQLSVADVVDQIDREDTIEPQRTGRWILDENDFLTKCSECGCHPWFGVIPTVKDATRKLPHCPVCLARMEENDEGD